MKTKRIMQHVGRRMENRPLPDGSGKTSSARQWGASFHLGRKFFILHSSLFLLLVLLAGCRKDLCYNHDEHAMTVKVHAAVTWEQEWERAYDHQWTDEWDDGWALDYDDLRPEIADGVRVVIYADEGESLGQTNLEAGGGHISSLPEGTHDLLFYNNDTEYIVFSGFEAAAGATASTRTVTRSGFESLHAEERTVNQPDMLYGHFEDDHEAQRTLEPVELPVEMRPLVYTYLVRYEFSHGLQYVALARGALAGMAESVFLTDGHTGNDAATVMYDCRLTDYGAEAQVRSFGVPNYPGDHYTRADGSPARYGLNLEVRLRNGAYKTYEFDVTDQVLGQPRGGVITVSDIEVSDEEGMAGGTGAFDVTVDDWGDRIDIPLPL